jgi:hypothetical protein
VKSRPNCIPTRAAFDSNKTEVDLHHDYSDFQVDFYDEIDSIFPSREAINFHDIAFCEFFALLELNGLNELFMQWQMLKGTGRV